MAYTAKDPHPPPPTVCSVPNKQKVGSGKKEEEKKSV